MSLRRRDLIAGAGTALAAVLAGCGGGNDAELNTPPPDAPTSTPNPTPTPDPVPNLEVAGFRRKIQDGTLVLEVTVENVGDQAASGTLIVTVTAGEQSTRKEWSVSVDAGGTKTTSLEFDIDVEAFNDDGGFGFGWRKN